MKNLPDSDLEAEEASGRHLEAKSQKSQPLCNGMQIYVCFVFQCYEMFLRVCVIKYDRFQSKMMPGSVCVFYRWIPGPSDPTPPKPLQIDLFGECSLIVNDVH